MLLNQLFVLILEVCLFFHDPVEFDGVVQYRITDKVA